MKKKISIALAVIALVQLACLPQLMVVNNTPDNVRVSITNQNDKITLSAAPGNTVTTDLAVGQYKAVAVPNDLWLDFAKSEEQTLTKLVLNPDSLTKEQIENIANQINKISENEQQMFKNAPAQATCTNSVSDKEDGRIEISGSADSNLSLNCTRVATSTEEP